MPIYKSNGKKDGLQKYNVRINYVSESGQAKQLTRVAYGLDAAKDLERRLLHDLKSNGENSVRKMTVRQLFEEYAAVKKYEVRQSTYDKTVRTFAYYIFPTLADVCIDKLSAKILQDWKISLEERDLALKTKKNVYSELRTMFNYAVRMEYLPKSPLVKVGNFKDPLATKQEINFIRRTNSGHISVSQRKWLCKSKKRKTTFLNGTIMCFSISRFIPGFGRAKYTRCAGAI